MPATTRQRATLATSSEATLRPPRFGFWKGLMTGMVIEIPAFAGAVWLLAQCGFGDPEVGYMDLLRFTTVFAGLAATLTAAGIGRLAAHASIEGTGGRRHAAFVAARAHAAAGAGLILIAAIPHGHLPTVRWHWLVLMSAGMVCGAGCGAAIGVVCGGASNTLREVVALARRPTLVLRAILDPEAMVKLGARVGRRTTSLFEGIFDPAPAPPAVPVRPATEGEPEDAVVDAVVAPAAPSPSPSPAATPDEPT
jgi:hypothetical protein